MPNSVYNKCEPIERVVSGFDRPGELYQVVVNRERVFIGYYYQCVSNRDHFHPGGKIKPLGYGKKSFK